MARNIYLFQERDDQYCYCNPHYFGSLKRALLYLNKQMEFYTKKGLVGHIEGPDSTGAYELTFKDPYCPPEWKKVLPAFMITVKKFL